MRTTKKEIAKQYSKPLPLRLRFFTALNITAKLYRSRGCTSADILYFLLDYQDVNINKELQMMTLGHAFSKKTIAEMREFFNDVYYDEDLILDWLNKKINKYYFSKQKKLNKGNDETQQTFNTILNENGVFGLLEKFKI